MIERGKGWTMHLGDCTDVMTSLAKVDHIITDPPYEAEAHTKGRRAFKGKSATYAKGAVGERPLDFSAMSETDRIRCGELFGILARRWILVFCQVEAAMLWRDGIHADYVRTCVWNKPDGAPQFTGDRPGMGYESIVCCHAMGRKRWNGGGRRGVFTHMCQADRPDHPTPKPASLMLELVDLFTDPGETVLDAFAGSGTTGLACVRTGREFIGIEKDPKYFAVAVERLRAEESGSTVHAQRAGQTSLFGVPRP